MTYPGQRPELPSLSIIFSCYGALFSRSSMIWNEYPGQLAGILPDETRVNELSTSFSVIKILQRSIFPTIYLTQRTQNELWSDKDTKMHRYYLKQNI